MSNPAWSVIIPTRNRPHKLARCLAAVARLDPPEGGFEVIVVNDGGADYDESLWPANDASPPVRLLSQSHAGPAVARNHGASVAVGKWLAFTDDDCEPEPGWLRSFERALTRQPDALAGGIVRNAIAHSIFSETSQVLVGFVAKWFDGSARERMFTTNNIALARTAFAEAGGFDARFGISAGEDREFCDRWSAQGRASCDVPDAIIYHAHELSLRSFVAQHFAYGRAARRIRSVRSEAGRPIRIDPSFYIASVRHAGGVKPISRGAALATWTMVAHAAYAAGLARELMSGDNRSRTYQRIKARD